MASHQTHTHTHTHTQPPDFIHLEKMTRGEPTVIQDAVQMPPPQVTTPPWPDVLGWSGRCPWICQGSPSRASLVLSANPLAEEIATPSIFLPGDSHGQRGLVSYSPRGGKESDMTERLNGRDGPLREWVPALLPCLSLVQI